MVRKRSQLENMSKNKLTDEVLDLASFKNDINLKFLVLSDRFNDFDVKYEMVYSNLSISRCCNELILECITQLERNNLINAHCNRRETLVINPVPSDIANNILEKIMCQALSPTGITCKLVNA